MSFHVGQKVVRIGSTPDAECNGRFAKQKYSQPDMGEVCTIATIHDWPGRTLLTFVEHDNCHLVTNGYEPGFNSKYFHPLQERSTDTGMAILRKVAADASKKRNLVTTR